MSTDYDNDLLKEGIACFKVGEFNSARRYFERALDVSDDYVTRSRAYFYLSQLTEDPQKKREYIEETLALDPVHPEARRELAILDGRLKREDIIDPNNTVTPPKQEPVAAHSERFTCPKCGGKMVYAPDGNTLQCEYCSRTKPLSPQLAKDQDFFAVMATGKGHSKPVSMQIFHCQGCGAEFILSPQELSLVCSYCGSAHVIQQQRDLAIPDAILPFGFTQGEASRRLNLWKTAKKISTVSREEIHPLYLPVWSFNIVGNIPWSGWVYKHKQRLAVSGEKSLLYNDIAVPASKKLPSLLPDLLAGFNYSVTSPYTASYLAGWPAEVHSISLSDAALEARRITVERVRKDIHLGFGHVADLRCQTSTMCVDSFKLVLVPVWLADLHLIGRSVPVALNGITGAIHVETQSRGILERVFRNI